MKTALILSLMIVLSSCSMIPALRGIASDNSITLHYEDGIADCALIEKDITLLRARGLGLRVKECHLEKRPYAWDPQDIVISSDKACHNQDILLPKKAFELNSEQLETLITDLGGSFQHHKYSYHLSWKCPSK